MAEGARDVLEGVGALQVISLQEPISSRTFAPVSNLLVIEVDGL